jgi:hypothetical protein
MSFEQGVFPYFPGPYVLDPTLLHTYIGWPDCGLLQPSAIRHPAWSEPRDWSTALGSPLVIPIARVNILTSILGTYGIC